MQNIREFVVFLLLSICTQENRCLKRSCPWSIRTLQYVSDCPTTKEDVEEAARIKDCEALAGKQNCTDPSKFKYHCVINDMGNAVVEVCAPVYYIHGFCTEFNVQGSIIQPHYGIRCSNMTPPCADRYLSTSAYLYPICYDVIKNRITSSLTETTTSLYNTTVHVGTDESDDLVLYLVIPSVLLVVMSALIGWWYRRKSHARTSQTKTIQSDPEGTSPLLQIQSSKGSISQESLTDRSVLVAPGQLLIDMYRKTVAEEERGELAAENEDLTKAYMDSFRSFETYFVETRVFKECQSKLQTEGVAVLIGPPGCGKTTVAIGIMKDESYKDWIKRKITSFTDFSLINSDRNSLLYIDNIFDGFMYQHELEKWWDILTTTYHKNISPNENSGEDSGIVSKAKGKIHLLITAKKSVFPTAFEYNKIKRTPVFTRNRIVDTSFFPLENTEKDKIFDKQMNYAEKVLNIPKPSVDPEFRHRMKISEGHVGFPLCAHLYACEEKHRPTGVNFFLYPINYLRKQIRYEIESDGTNRVKTLFLLIFLRECLSLSKGCEERLDLRDSTKYRQFLIEEFSDKMVEQIEPLFSGDLEDIANRLTVLIVRQDESVYRFKHQTICDAVGFYFCTEWPKAAFEYFPIDAFEKHEFVNPSTTICNSLLSRVFDEVHNRNVSKALACVALKQETFALPFCENLRSKQDLGKFLVQIDAASSYSLPPLFWISKYKHMRLSKLLDELIKEKGIQVEHSFYLARFGECCANDENFLRKTDPNAFNSTTALKKVVLQYTGDNAISILQLVMMSERHDYNAFMIIQKLLKDGKSGEFHNEIASNPCGQRVVNCAAREKRYSRILCILALYDGNTHSQQTPDTTECSPIHAVLEVLMNSTYSLKLELEMLIRMCLFIIYGDDPTRKTQNGQSPRDVCKNTSWKNIHDLLCRKSPSQVKMSNIIAQLLKKNDMQHANAPNINFPDKQLSKPLLNVIKAYVHHFAERELPA